MKAPSAMRIFDPCPPCGRQGRPGQGFLAGSILRAAGERPPRARPQRRGSPGPIPNPAVKPAFAESTAARGCGRAGRRARGGRFSICAERGPRGDRPLRAFCAFGGNEPNGPRRSLRVLYFQLRGCLDSRIGVATYVTLCKELRNMRGYGFDRASFACGVFDAFKLLSRCMRSVKSALV